MRSAADLEETLAGLLPPGTALLEGDELVLLSAEPASIAAESIALPAEPETPEVLRARMKELADEAPGRMTNIARGAFSEGRLWLLTEDGQVASMADGGGPLQREALGAKVVDLCSGARGLAAVTGERRQGRGWSLMRRSGGRWIEEASVARTGDGAIALSCEGEAESLLTTSRFITFAAGRPRVLALAETLPLALVTAAVHVTPAAVFLGINAGEWGGGLRRIDRATGRVATIERKEGEGACRLPLDAACDPVNAIATPPWRTDCVVAAVGLVHMMASGRLLSVCGGTVELLFAAPLDPHLADREDARRAAKGGIGSVPFYGLVTRGPDLVAVGHDALYVVGKNGTAVRQPFPRFRLIDGVYVTFDVPGAILVLTEISRRASLSGGAPMLVQRP
jgi:hypothetical protein